MKSHIRALDWYRHRWPWMTLNGVIAFILCFFFSEFDSFQTDYVTVVEDRPIMSVKYRFTVIFGQNWPTQLSHSLLVTDKLLVDVRSDCRKSDRPRIETILHILLVSIRLRLFREKRSDRNCWFSNSIVTKHKYVLRLPVDSSLDGKRLFCVSSPLGES